MAKLNIPDLVAKMMEAAKAEIGPEFKDAKDFASQSFKTILENAELLANKAAAGDINEEEAKILVRMQATAARSVLLTVKGIGILTAQKAINAAIGVVRDAVNGLLPVAVL